MAGRVKNSKMSCKLACSCGNIAKPTGWWLPEFHINEDITFTSSKITAPSDRGTAPL